MESALRRGAGEGVRLIETLLWDGALFRRLEYFPTAPWAARARPPARARGGGRSGGGGDDGGEGEKEGKREGE